MKVLYTAFKGRNNTSFQLISRFDAPSRFLTNSLQGVERDISLITEHFDMVIMFGVNSNLKNRVKIETCAVQGSDCVISKFNIEELVRKCKNNLIDCSISCEPTGYLCNVAYFQMLKKISETVFIHIPSIKWMNDNLMGKLMFFENYGLVEE